MLWQISLLITAPTARTLTFVVLAEPTDAELDDLMAENGAESATVVPLESGA